MFVVALISSGDIPPIDGEPSDAKSMTMAGKSMNNSSESAIIADDPAPERGAQPERISAAMIKSTAPNVTRFCIRDLLMNDGVLVKN